MLVRLEMKKNHITGFKSALRTVLISWLLHAISCHVKVFAQNVKNLIVVSKDRVNCLNWRTVGGVRKKNWQCLNINCFIWSHFRGITVRGIVPPFSKREPLCPLMLLLRGEATKISFQAFIDNFSLTICLGVIT